jgi:predicted metal-dependent HD superfamily phosphohydrolase
MNYAAAQAFILDKLRRELQPELLYHGIHHTLDVLNITIELCTLEGIGPHDTLLLKTAALFHDAGFIFGGHNHEAASCTIAREWLPQFQYDNTDIDRICGMIMATKIPQTPLNALEEILCDADLDYLGRDDFYTIGNTLFEELKSFNLLEHEDEWNQLQIAFLAKHAYFTNTSLNRRNAIKHRHLNQLIAHTQPKP